MVDSESIFSIKMQSLLKQLIPIDTIGLLLSTMQKKSSN